MDYGLWTVDCRLIFNPLHSQFDLLEELGYGYHQGPVHHRIQQRTAGEEHNGAGRADIAGAEACPMLLNEGFPGLKKAFIHVAGTFVQQVEIYHITGIPFLCRRQADISPI